MISKKQTKTGAIMRYRGMIFKTLAQTVLLYGSKSRVIMGSIMKFMEAFHHRIARMITEKSSQIIEEEVC